MKRSFRSARAGVGMTLVLGMLTMLGLGCGAIGAGDLLGLETCDVFNCDGLFFGSLADDHEDMDGMDGVDDADADDHDGMDGMDGADDDHDGMDDDGDDDHVDDMGDPDHDDGDGN